MPHHIHSARCNRCQHELPVADQPPVCPKCGSDLIEFSWAPGGGVVFNGGPGTVTIPVFPCGDPSNTVVKVEGPISVHFGDETKHYRFGEFKRFRRKAKDNWVQVNLRRDRRGIDVLFGRRSGEHAGHSHYTYESRARAIYFRDTNGTSLTRELGFIGDAGAFMPLTDRIIDANTQTALTLTFSLKNELVVVSDVLFSKYEGG